MSANVPSSGLDPLPESAPLSADLTSWIAMIARRVNLLARGGSQSWTPADQSGANLTFTGVRGRFTRVGNLIFAYATLTYPATADGSTAKISLPITVPNQNYAEVAGPVISGILSHRVLALPNTATAEFTGKNPVAVLTNADMSTATIDIMLAYPAS